MSAGKLCKVPFGLALTRVSSGLRKAVPSVEQEKGIHATYSVPAPQSEIVSSTVYSADGEELVYRNSGAGHGYGQGVKELEVWMMLESARAKAFDDSVKNVIAFKLDP